MPWKLNMQQIAALCRSKDPIKKDLGLSLKNWKLTGKGKGKVLKYWRMLSPADRVYYEQLEDANK